MTAADNDLVEADRVHRAAVATSTEHEKMDLADADRLLFLAEEEGQLAGRPRNAAACRAGAAALREVQALRAAQSVWQPIGTCPKTLGCEFLLLVKSRAGIPYGRLVGHWMPGGHCIEDHPPIDEGWYFFNGSAFDLASEPTHWMPLPALPDEVRHAGG